MVRQRMSGGTQFVAKGRNRESGKSKDGYWQTSAWGKGRGALIEQLFNL